MGVGLQGAGRPIWVINGSNRLDLTHSISSRLTHHNPSTTLTPGSFTGLGHLTTNPGPMLSAGSDSAVSRLLLSCQSVHPVYICTIIRDNH